ncbi:penicillin-binding protein 1B [Beggiatoa leptomitoformis]|uniref:Penicillin-binding protein 1B n=1 Tax=Beggiatoa leptomitoformis TaxID=288004 RepID=A0A2N9YIN0_9GAMM|nr:penicillin-binding protein 1B [Beggiatoa leptomitoformis]ALG69388.2 penicillin-binding protein 1B [Beggiatoa leptomitoformis]AUI70215.1 penicillin-binding protein 1B [Beggiatoa leptomitoformis]
MTRIRKKKTTYRRRPTTFIPQNRNFRFRWRWLVLILVFIPTAFYISWLDVKVREEFDGHSWALPARVYASPVEIYAGMTLNPDSLVDELKAIGYKESTDMNESGQFYRVGTDISIMTRAFQFWDANEPAQKMRIRFLKDNKVEWIRDESTKKSIALARLEPKMIGKIYPTQNEDRVLVKYDELPPLLVKGLVAVEDRTFFEHNGLSIRGIMRAMVANAKAGDWVQGGSTITQQLVKNLYLNAERTFDRKMNEAVMALLLEWHYSKAQILEAYVNEVYLGQDGNRSIHGMGVASSFYFNKPVEQLKLPEIALLVSLVRAASLYNPRKHPDRAVVRRNLVLDLMAERGVITQADAQQAKGSPLEITDEAQGTVFPYPAFLELVRRQLREDYREEDLRNEGLQVFTTLDPFIQNLAEKAMVDGIKKLAKTNRRFGELEGAMVVTSSEGGEILALVNGKKTDFAGFNRPLDARRQIGSLVKVAVYLTALEDTRAYSLTSMLNDTPYEWRDRKTGQVWTPKNYDFRVRGRVPLHFALANSLNLATVHLGMELGLEKIRNTLRRMGVERDFTVYPSMLLGSVALTPLEVAQMYQTLASSGFRVPLRSIRNVLTHDAKPLQRYALSVEQRFDSAPVFLLNYALQNAVREGTGRQVAKTLPKELIVAGKTGTTNELRDSWFVGFDSELMTVTWIGRDDNKPMGLSGSSGAMRIWSEFIQSANTRSLAPITPNHVEWRWVDSAGNWSNRGASGALLVPFITNHTETNTMANNTTINNTNLPQLPLTGGTIKTGSATETEDLSANTRSP